MTTRVGHRLSVLMQVVLARSAVCVLALAECLLAACSYSPPARSVTPQFLERSAPDPGRQTDPATSDDLVVRVERDTVTIHSVVVEHGEDLGAVFTRERGSARLLRVVLLDGYDEAALSRVLLAAIDARFSIVAMNVGPGELRLPLDSRRTADSPFVVYFDGDELAVYDLRRSAKPRLLASFRPGDMAAEEALRGQLSVACSCGAYRASVELAPGVASGSMVSALESWERVTDRLRTISSALAYVGAATRGSRRRRLSRLMVGRILQNHVTPILACFDNDPTRKEDLSRPLKVALTVQPDGSLTDVKARSVTIADAAALDCVLQTVAKLEFPSPGAEPASVVYPIIWGAPLPRD